MPVDRSFPALLNKSNEDGANIKIDSSFEEEAEDVTRQKTLDREERTAWREAQKRQVEMQMAELQAEDKKRADELQAEDKKRSDEIHMAERVDEIKIQIVQIEAAKEQAKIDKELKIKEMELQAQQVQATANSATTRILKRLLIMKGLDQRSEHSSYEYVTELHERLEDSLKLAQEELQNLRNATRNIMIGKLNLDIWKWESKY